MTPEAFKFILTIIRSVGWWPPTTGGRVYGAWSGFCLLVLGTMSAFQLVHVYESAGDLRVFTESFCLVLSLANLWFKGLHMLARRRDVARLLQRATADIDDDCRRLCGHVLLCTARRIRTLGAAFIGISYTSALLWILSPVAALLLDPDAQPSLPLKTWYPYDVLRAPHVYWCTYCTQVFYIWVVVSSYSALTIIYIVLVVAACSRFQIMSEFLGVAEHSAKEEGFDDFARVPGNIDAALTTNVEDTGDEEGRKSTDYQNLPNIWIEYMNYHRTAFEYVKDLDNVFNPVVLVEFLTCLGIICQAGFLVIVKSKDISDFLKYSGYLGTTIFELLLYCWHANEIQYQSSAVQTAAYDSPWCDGSPQQKTAVQMVMARSQRRLALTAGNMHAVSLDSFTAILKDSYSIFALLRQISDEE